MPFLKTLIVNRKLLIGKKNPDERKTINHKQSFSANKPAFTLIELLVVIAIIGILASLGTFAYTDSQKKGRDSKRKTDLSTIQKALELAKQDSAGSYSYPGCRTPAVNCTITTVDDNTSSTNGTLNPDLIGTNYSYIKAIPVDPKTATAYTIIPTPASCAAATCTGFSLVACLENLKDPQRDTTNVSPCDGTTTKSYTITNL